MPVGHVPHPPSLTGPGWVTPSPDLGHHPLPSPKKQLNGAEGLTQRGTDPPPPWLAVLGA